MDLITAGTRNTKLDNSLGFHQYNMPILVRRNASRQESHAFPDFTISFRTRRTFPCAHAIVRGAVYDHLGTRAVRGFFLCRVARQDEGHPVADNVRRGDSRAARNALQFMPNKILRKPSVLDRTGWSAPTLWRRVKDGSFPPPRQIGPRAVGWLESEVEAAIAAFPVVDQEKRPSP